MSEEDNERVWYFSFGANMAPATLQRREGISPTRSLPGSLTGFVYGYTYLGYDDPPCEPRFANIEPAQPGAPAAPVHGVAHCISMREMRILDKYEGAGISYERVLADFTRKLPFREGAFDLDLSISAIQWVTGDEEVHFK